MQEVVDSGAQCRNQFASWQVPGSSWVGSSLERLGAKAWVGHLRNVPGCHRGQNDSGLEKPPTTPHRGGLSFLIHQMGSRIPFLSTSQECSKDVGTQGLGKV